MAVVVRVATVGVLGISARPVVAATVNQKPPTHVLV